MSSVRSDSSLIDIAYVVCTALYAVGTIAVLTGGSAATFYTYEYQSLDIDFVLRFTPAGVFPEDAVLRLGFARIGQQYVHPQSTFTVDFPPGPLAIGNEIIESHETTMRAGERLHVLSRTDCVRDRLAAFYHWNDRGSLATALVVAASGPIDLRKIERWSAHEGATERYREFERQLQR